MRQSSARRAVAPQRRANRPQLTLIVRPPTRWERWRRVFAHVPRDERFGEAAFIAGTLGLMALLLACLARAVGGYAPLP